jgi:hypothetical protein
LEQQFSHYELGELWYHLDLRLVDLQNVYEHLKNMPDNSMSRWYLREIDRLQVIHARVLEERSNMMDQVLKLK